MKHADDVSCQRKQDAKRYVNTYMTAYQSPRAERYDWTIILWSYTDDIKYI